MRYAHSEAYIRRLAKAHGFKVRELQRAPLRKSLQEPLDALCVYLECVILIARCIRANAWVFPVN